MAYITAEEVNEKRKALKAAFPGWKFSVTKERFSSINVVIQQAPIDFLAVAAEKAAERPERAYAQHDPRKDGYCQVNHYWIDQHWPDGEAREALQRIRAICMAGNYDNSDMMSDYHDVGFYFHLSVGRWNKPFILSQ